MIISHCMHGMMHDIAIEMDHVKQKLFQAFHRLARRLDIRRAPLNPIEMSADRALLYFIATNFLLLFVLNPAANTIFYFYMEQIVFDVFYLGGLLISTMLNAFFYVSVAPLRIWFAVAIVANIVSMLLVDTPSFLVALSQFPDSLVYAWRHAVAGA